MEKEVQRAAASKGGKSAHEKGTAHKFTREEAAEAGRKGGLAVSTTPGHMRDIGQKGAEAQQRRRGMENELQSRRVPPGKDHPSEKNPTSH